MTFEAILVKRQDGLYSLASAHDGEELKPVKTGRPIRITGTQVSQRSLDHHRLYWGGLVELTYGYWEPKGGLISSVEVKAVKNFCKYLDNMSGNTGAVYEAGKGFIAELMERRGERVISPEKSKKALHKWIKEEAGYYDLIITPTGTRKEVKSINFNAMTQEDFNVFYKAAFAVCWKFILIRAFEDGGDAESAIENLLRMG